MILLIWWYLVAFNPSDPQGVGSSIGEFDSYEGKGGCSEQLDLYYVRNPRGFARCEGYPTKIDMNTRDGRKQRELNMRNLELEVENKELQAEIRRRILKGELSPRDRPK